MALCMDGAGLLSPKLPPGFRFHPTDQELILHYLRKKATGTLPPASDIIAEVDLYKFNPWELPEKAFFGEGEWFFFSPRDRKYPNGVRPNRAAACGYWKATGTDKPILAADSSQCLGVKKALVFYKGRPPKGVKSDWVMHEYRLLDSSHSHLPKRKGSMRLDDWVLCRVRQKGAMTPESEIATALPNSPQSYLTSNTDAEKERSDAVEWSDQQLMGYLMGTCESMGESSDPGSTRTSGTGGCRSFGALQPTPPPQLMDSVLCSIKRKLSFGALDELIMMQPGGKRQQQYWVGDDLSPTESASVNQGFDGFLL
ncbi:hypothetical protein HPP92_023876 [Vanilla planifolia]|uniref:NAC domain-containing protein n=1 Tax=Vanilla planifolia TaxID=51239 RepID=A0A835U9E7_VANPL|nr:hypothetical protein HPP92_023876 [Vanilla planifolia]